MPTSEIMSSMQTQPRDIQRVTKTNCFHCVLRYFIIFLYQADAGDAKKRKREDPDNEAEDDDDQSDDGNKTGAIIE
jgi:hypothetical protein